ncbi:flagellar basal-body MS-ring/collar protein FliF [Salinarimonas ramus]|uniref:Flagellar M-ring protein n=1 Tax=Salinarimonas ramus TaxID=690164 RepID=A0A917Q7A7_9HYPH|nr:flagellar basal-body MS-ring/collar protein FliF [Salinarimonas ramus]GGK31056.1 flagellar M-ring protein [Salinarimonas ramus]
MTAYQHADRLWGNLLELGTRRLLALAAIGIAVIVSVVAGAYYLGRPEMTVLYAGLEREDVSRIGSALNDAGIDFDVSAAGDTVMVRHAQTARARMLLAEKGLPFSANSGYELFDNLGSLGITSFMQEVTRVRALEGEIARTIQQMRGIVAARVHIVLADPGSFRREAQAPSASVVVRAETADVAGQAQAIRHLVAAAVPGMNVAGVTVLSSDGTLLASGDDAAGASSGRITALNRELNRELEDSVRRTLAPYLGLDNFQVSVAARINTDRRVVSETIFDPDSRVERSIRIVRENEAATNLSRETPVTVEQNLPEEEVAADGGEQSSEEMQRREELTNFEISSRQVQVSSDGFAIEQLSLAILVNRARLVDAIGPDATPEQIEAEIAEIEALAASAAGVDPARGDSVKVSAVAFLDGGVDMEPVPEIGIRDVLMAQAGNIVNALAILLVAMTLIWFGLKPAMAAILDRPKASAEIEESMAALADASEAQGREAQPALADASGTALPHAAQIEAATAAIAALPTSVSAATIKRLEQIVTRNEDQAAHILKQWMHGENA